MTARDLRPNDAVSLLQASRQVLLSRTRPNQAFVGDPWDALTCAVQSAEESAGYNGWTNYETWCVHLWLTNDEGSYNASRELAQEPEDAGEAAQALKEIVEDTNPYADANNLYTDLLNAALSSVNWYEVGEALRE